LCRVDHLFCPLTAMMPALLPSIRLALAVPALLLAFAHDASAQRANARGQVFTCVNAAGRTLTSDRLIAECMDREQRVLASDGSVLRVVPPSLTAEEWAAKDAREKRIVAEKEARVEAVKRDRLMLQRFPSEAEHLKARNAALEDIRLAMVASESRIAELERERKPLLEESEFYKGKSLPPKLKQQLDVNEAAVAAQRDAQVQQQGEIARINRRFDVEAAHLKRLWAGASPGTLDVADGERAGKPIKPTTAQAR
jgi:hypothetical protein